METQRLAQGHTASLGRVVLDFPTNVVPQRSRARSARQWGRCNRETAPLANGETGETGETGPERDQRGSCCGSEEAHLAPPP